MKALYLDAPQKPALRDIPEPVLNAGEALLRVRYVGLCGTDLSTFRGRNPLVTYPRILGHEISATVAKVAEGAPAWIRPGVDVALMPYSSCGECPSCRAGRPNACRAQKTLGVQRDGALAEWVAAPWEKLRTSGRLSARELCLVEPLTVGFHAVARARVQKSDTVLVIGCGMVGYGAIAGAAQRGATIIALDLDDTKLAVARQTGATHTINSHPSAIAGGASVHDRLLELTSGDGPSVTIEAAGAPDTFRMAVEEVAFAGRVAYVGWSKEPVTYDTRHFVQKELDILGSRNSTPEDFEAVIKMLERGEFPLAGTISAVVSLEQAGEALRAWAENPLAYRKILVEVAANGG
ncbi:MAG: zinc-binding alcohol dehydrogenase family protein [Candidatus Acidiferrales bacterium]